MCNIELLNPTHPPSWKTTPCQLSTTELFTKYYQRYQIQEDGMYGAWSVHNKCIRNCSQKTRREETTWKT
jgi:hypothetical protein